MSLMEHALHSHKGVHEARMVMSPSYSRMLQNILYHQNITNLVDFALATSIRTSYMDHIFSEGYRRYLALCLTLSVSQLVRFYFLGDVARRRTT